MNFTGKTIWITGASSGIGKAVAIELSVNNTYLILSGRKEEALNDVRSGRVESIEEVAKELGGLETCGWLK